MQVILCTLVMERLRDNRADFPCYIFAEWQQPAKAKKSRPRISEATEEMSLFRTFANLKCVPVRSLSSANSLNAWFGGSAVSTFHYVCNVIITAINDVHNRKPWNDLVTRRCSPELRKFTKSSVIQFPRPIGSNIWSTKSNCWICARITRIFRWSIWPAGTSSTAMSSSAPCTCINTPRAGRTSTGSEWPWRKTQSTRPCRLRKGLKSSLNSPPNSWRASLIGPRPPSDKGRTSTMCGATDWPPAPCTTGAITGLRALTAGGMSGKTLYSADSSLKWATCKPSTISGSTRAWLTGRPVGTTPGRTKIGATSWPIRCR